MKLSGWAFVCIQYALPTLDSTCWPFNISTRATGFVHERKHCGSKRFAASIEVMDQPA
jgi:hypothetical protein